MKKLNLLSKAEMKKVLGGGVPAGGGAKCNQECANDGEPCKDETTSPVTYWGRCTFYAATTDCPAGYHLCV